MISLSLSSLIRDMGIITVPTTLGGCEDSVSNTCEILGTELGVFLSMVSALYCLPAVVIFIALVF